MRARRLRSEGALRSRCHRRIRRWWRPGRDPGGSRTRGPVRETRPRSPCGPRPRPRTGVGGAALRRRIAGRRVGDVRGERPRDAGGRSPGRPDAGGRAVSSDRDRALRPARPPDQREAGGRPASAPRRAAPRPQHPAGHGPGLRGPGGPAHPDRRRQGARVHRLPGVQPACPRRRSRARDRPHHDPHPDGLALSRAPDCSRSTSASTTNPCSSSSRTPAGGTTPSGSRAPRATTRTWGIPATPTARTTSTPRERDSTSARAADGRRSTSSSTPCSTTRTPSAWTIPGRGRGTSCSCARLPISSASPPPAPAISIPRTVGTRPTSRCGCTTATRISSQPRGSA